MVHQSRRDSRRYHPVHASQEAPAQEAAADAPEGEGSTPGSWCDSGTVAADLAGQQTNGYCGVLLRTWVEDKSDEYTDVMQQRMGTSLTYRHEDGMNYNRILDDLIVGSCLQTPEDADK